MQVVEKKFSNGTLHYYVLDTEGKMVPISREKLNFQITLYGNQVKIIPHTDKEIITTPQTKNVFFHKTQNNTKQYYMIFDNTLISVKSKDVYGHLVNIKNINIIKKIFSDGSLHYYILDTEGKMVPISRDIVVVLRSLNGKKKSPVTITRDYTEPSLPKKSPPKKSTSKKTPALPRGSVPKLSKLVSPKSTRELLTKPALPKKSPPKKSQSKITKDCKSKTCTCKINYSEYKDVCNKIWNDVCTKDMTNDELEQIRRFSTKCAELRVDFSMNCKNARIDIGHLGAIRKVLKKSNACLTELKRREK